MKKYIARELDMENFEYSAYYDEICAETDDIWIGGNRDFQSFNDKLYDEAMDFLEDMDNEIGDCWNEVDEDDPEYECKVYLLQLEAVADYTKLKKDDPKVIRLLDIVEEYRHNYNHEDEAVVKVLTELKGKQFDISTLRGSYQGEWVKCIYPVELKNNIDYIEAVYFGTGKEFEISCDMIEPDEFETAMTFCDYTTYYKATDIKKWLADMLNCSEDDIELQLIDTVKMVKKYSYKNY